jgi:hypothetical protein
MKISELISKLKKLKEVEGDIEVTCTGSYLPDGYGGPVPDVFETTVVDLTTGTNPKIGKKVRLS